ncbi:dynactin-associated protein isoform X2 [Mycteria americana]|uniref:dynactin-associated protein isoform X2 n=1 Tax=Mycteria americana TaxID=33587 RepID=UPI003F58E471
MDNQAFEMHGESIQSSSKGKEWPKKEERKGSWSLMKVFLVCLLACVITTAIGVLVLSLVYVKNTAFMKDTGIKDNGASSPKPDEKSVDMKFQFLNHLGKSKGTAWIGVIHADDNVITTYNVTAGQVIFFPRNTVHWIKNVGSEDCVFLLFFTTHEELQTLDVDDAFFSTPEDIAARALKPQGGVNFIRTFKKQVEDQAINLPPNLNELVQNATYVQSPDNLVWRYFYNLKGSAEYHFPGGIFQWARYRINGAGLNETEKIFSESLNKHENTLTLATLRIFSNELGQPHFHFNANEMGYVISGCGQAGVILSSGVTTSFNIGIGDVIFFPVGTQHYLKSICDEDLFLILAYSTGNQLETLRMNDYFRGTADHILAQLFSKEQAEFNKFPRAAKK